MTICLVILFLLAGVRVPAVYGIGYEIYVYKVKSWENSRTWEPGTEEFTVTGYLRVSPTQRDLGCIQCSRNGDCERTGSWGRIWEEKDSWPAKFEAKIDAWEDDKGSRCSYNSGDDGRTQRSCWPTLQQGAAGSWNWGECGDGSHKIYYRWRWWYVNCRGGPGVSTSVYTHSCSNVQPGRTCTVSCRPGYLPASSIYRCASNNQKFANRVSGTAPRCILPTPAPTPAPT
eukprot:Sspe_Gene.5920::Locus_1978_Transcript_1_1_Confidence_1.000_Length_724::g.5920::m.5920